MVDHSEERWEVLGVFNEDTPGHEVATYRLVLTGFMTPSVFPGQKIMYQVSAGNGLLYRQEKDVWYCIPAASGGMFDIMPNQAHFFCSPDGQMEVSVLGSPTLPTIRRAVPAPTRFVLPGTVSEVLEDGSIICQTAIGLTRPKKPSQPVAKGQKISVLVDFSAAEPLEDEEKSTPTG